MSDREPGTLGLRVLHCVDRWLPLTQGWLRTQVRQLEGRVANIVVCRQTENLDRFDVHPLWVESEARGLFGFTLKLHRRLGVPWLFATTVASRERVGIIHSHFGNVACENIWTARLVRARHVVTFYGYDVQRLPAESPVWKGRYRQLFAGVDRVFCEGPHMRECLLKLDCPPEKAQIHHLGVELDRLPFKPRHWTPGQTLRVLLAGSFVEKKGFPYAIEALAFLARKVDLQVTLIGDARLDPDALAEKVRILEAIQRNHLSERTRLLGYQPYDTLLREAYRHHLFLAPSVTAQNGDTEGGAPVTIIEMAATGMPVVSTRHCDIPHVIEDDVTGLLAPERDPQALAARLSQLLARAQDWGVMVVAARHRVEAEFNASIQAQRLGDVYARLAQSLQKSTKESVELRGAAWHGG